jgi:hypothetical protein
MLVIEASIVAKFMVAVTGEGYIAVAASEDSKTQGE